MAHLLVFARHPRMGQVKTRLGRSLGPVTATFWYRRQLVRLLDRLGPPCPWRCHLFLTGGRPRLHPPWPDGWTLHDQGPGDLGARMHRALSTPQAGPVVLVGSDIPEITTRHVRSAFRALGRADIVLGPARDGGYWLIGISARRAPPAFGAVRWSTAHALADTMRSFGRNRRVVLLDELSDVDDAADFAAYRIRSRGRTARVP